MISLLSKPHANPKLAKGEIYGFLSAPLHLAPARLSGVNVCPMSTPGCRAACLHTAGNPIAMERKESARIRRTRFFFDHRAKFMAQLVKEIAAHEKRAKGHGMLPTVRLNATSDIRWEAIPCSHNGVEYRNVMSAFPGVRFYDYTKIANRRNVPSNYHLTFSLAENNDTQALAALANGMNVATVLNLKKTEPMPPTFTIMGKAFPVIDGDMNDLRFADPRGVIVSLRPKGKAKHDRTGFVRSVTL